MSNETNSRSGGVKKQGLRIPGSRHDYPAITAAILHRYTLDPNGIHGVEHWARVLLNALTLAESTGADPEVVALFALFHDSCRINDNRDYHHGRRGAELALSLRGTLVHLDDARFSLLWDACCYHTDGLTDGETAVQVCWDADRLDLGRVGITPQPDRLCTEVARLLLPQAHTRSTGNCIPGEIFGFLWL